MQRPQSAEEYITVVDNKGRERIQRVEYTVTDVRDEKVYVTVDGLAYARDSLICKGQDHILQVFDCIPAVMVHPEIVIRDHQSPDDTLIYYKRLYVSAIARHQLVCVVVKVRQGIRYLYNFFAQQSGKVKGYRHVPPPEIWYIAPGKKARDYGLPAGF
jgi:hypothetical protein